MSSVDQRAQQLVRSARRRGRLSQAELARRAGMPRSVVNAYERGTREPGAAALARLADAAGLEITLGTKAEVDAAHSGHVLSQVLDLAESLPFRRSQELQHPPFTRRLQQK
jgi:transcriptional regulator with XRE-family HTH domain